MPADILKYAHELQKVFFAIHVTIDDMQVMRMPAQHNAWQELTQLLRQASRHEQF